MPEIGFLDALAQKWNSGGTGAPYQPQPASTTPAQSAQYAQAAFGAPPEAPFVPVEAQPLQVAYQQAAQQPQAQPQYVPVTETQVQSKVASPEAEKARQKAIAADAEAIAADKRASELESQVTQTATQKVVGEIDTAKAELNSALSELSGKKVIDPMEKWGTGKQIGAAIAMGLGAFAASYSGGKNHAAEIINNSIQRDIDMQEREMQRLGKNVDVKRNALAQAYNRLGDIAQAKDVVYQAALAGVSKDVESLAASAKSERVKANALALNSSLQGKRAEAVARTNETIVSSTTKQVAMGGSASEKARAEKERDEAMQFEAGKNAIMAAFESGQKQGKAGMVPSWMGGSKAEREASVAQVAGAIIGKMPGVRSDSDFRNIIAPQLPSPMDPPDTIEHKRKNLMEYIKSNAPAGWLKMHGGEKSAENNLKQQLGFSK